MKKFFTYLTITLMTVGMGTTMTSCDDDVEIAINLSGDWQGDFGMYFSDGYVEWDAAYSYLRFTPAYEYATHGVGEEIDYFDRSCPVRSQSFLFEWRVNWGVLELRYPYAHELDVDIYDYVMDRNYFSGRVGNTHFTLSKLYDFYGWSAYSSSYDYYTAHGGGYYGYGGYSDYGWYHSKKRDGELTDSTAAAVTEQPTIKLGRRFK